MTNLPNKNAPIGIFDSGMGGLTVTQTIKNHLPNERIIYFGDTAHLPYGDKSKETLVKYCLEIVDFLLQQGAKAIVVACNSATSNAWDEIVEYVGDKALVFNVIDPVVEKIAYELHSTIGLIATKATVNSKFYPKKLRKLNKHIKMAALSTPLLVPIIEEGLVKSDIAKLTLEHYLENKALKDIDSLILGCTHYPLMSDMINNYYNGKITIIDSPMIVANTIAYQFQKNDLQNNSKNNEPDLFYVSDYTKHFESLAKSFFGSKIELNQLSLSSK